jgi:hypothetical protein
MQRPSLPPLLLGLGLIAACSNAPPPLPPASGPRGEEVSWRPVRPRAPLVLDDAQRSPNVPSTLPPGTHIEFAAAPTAAAGIPLPGGAFLPALNGVATSGAIERPAEHGPVPPVIGLTIDESGFEWYEHQDGSLTTSRWVFDATARRWRAVTMHAVPSR